MEETAQSEAAKLYHETCAEIIKLIQERGWEATIIPRITLGILEAAIELWYKRREIEPLEDTEEGLRLVHAQICKIIASIELEKNKMH